MNTIHKAEAKTNDVFVPPFIPTFVSFVSSVSLVSFVSLISFVSVIPTFVSFVTPFVTIERMWKINGIQKQNS